ncbi:nicotinate-nucleotide pyrophosphorylase (carboxylating) [[Leptolyngbya] sp. PCC 7376]|uniref:carboxylating nicotinate-nucleotide diphosphorylase n=1 Tax=[Leptolyngbya] sp. PCC 7376 TaxID=111781 RepID=UPI00029F085D|nr:carboxylating nicotinate-nucleotide diphosphorylase [[Leptolyngbya] sp. PCC 7376]AFY39426.1 nicotinate-nucleotide pyrophosphorylase (carboxylating) [[Leptolyngbya] sp. PCC 7376]
MTIRIATHKVLVTPPAWLLVDPFLKQWLQEDLGRGDRTTEALFTNKKIPTGQAQLILKAPGIVAGLPFVERVFQLIGPDFEMQAALAEGKDGQPKTLIATLTAPLDTLLMGERVALNILMRLSGIATETAHYARKIEDLPTTLVDTRKTTPGLRLLEKYAVRVGGGRNHRYGLDDAMMIKDNHIQAAGGITEAIAAVRANSPYPLAIEVEAETLEQAIEAVQQGADIVMLDNMSPAKMAEVIPPLREINPRIKLEASGNITLETIRAVAETGIDFISTSATITRAPWLDISMKITA